MKLPTPLLALALVLSPVLAPTPTDLTKAERVRVEQQVTDFLGTYLEALETRDEAAIRSVFAGDGRFAWFTDGVKRYGSTEEVLESLASFGDMRFTTETEGTEVLPLTPTLAHAHASFRTEIHQGERMVHAYGGIITWLVEQDAESRWRVLRGHTSTPKPRDDGR